MAQAYSEEIKDAAKSMFLRRVPVREIKETLNLNSTRVVYQWSEKGRWEDMLQHETVEQAAARKLISLINKENKTDKDFQEINHLMAVMDKCANIDLKKARTAKEKSRAGLEGSADGKKKKRNSSKNDISDITPEALAEIRNTLFFDYQDTWYNNKHQRTRFILKSRQIGATYYFAYEALEDAILSGDNQIFLSASRSQADVFKAYIIKFAKEHFDVELKGSDVITLSNGAELRFISTNSRTAQSYHGHLYIDEVFWIPGFDELNKLASAMASQKKWRKTYISTPSVKSHGAYPMWSGDKYNDKRKTKVDFDLSHETLVNGALGPDRIWRHVVTIKDAENQGCDLFDIDELKDEYSTIEFNNLFMCQFLEAGMSVFDFDKLLNCAVDSNVVWVDFNKRQVKPYGTHPVWLGYDPARRGDRSMLVVIAPPNTKNDKFRVLEKIHLQGAYQHQANRIKELTEKYNVEFMGIDCTGPGLGVYEMVQAFFPNAKGIHYNLETKTRLVLKGIDVVDDLRIQWDAEHTDIPQGFLQIHSTTTKNDHITYESSRDNNSGHADAAWAILNGLSNEPLNRQGRKGSFAIGN